MARIVMKFGGTSMAGIERIRHVASLVKREVEAGNQIAVVVSAMAGETDRLVQLCREAASLYDPREYDVVVASGEQVTSGLLAITLQGMGLNAKSYMGWQLPIRTSGHGAALIEGIDAAVLERVFDEGGIAVIPGFQGVTEAGDVTTLGRGGSDTSAVAIAAAMKADECLIYTDVDGVYTTDPRVVSDARRLKTVTFEEMLEMASLGSKVLQSRSVEFAGNYRMPTRVLSSLTDPMIPLEEEARSGTLISFEEENNMEQAVISGIAFNRDEAKITILGVPDKPGVAYHILGPVADANIEVDMIIQNQSVEGKTDFTFTVTRGEYAKALAVLEKTKVEIGAASVLGDAKVSKVSVVGVGMRSHVGVASQMFRTLSEEGINILMISTSEIKISVLIDEKYMELAVRALHKAFDLEKA